ncbi:hypothetical protein [Hymenobacter sp. B1770]|uniref:hypothetical protein n=1 Tax=Hymenobacter sp. B1770 TaxID=1718788 RepID=UPI003CEF103A
MDVEMGGKGLDVLNAGRWNTLLGEPMLLNSIFFAGEKNFSGAENEIVAVDLTLATLEADR